MDLNIMKGSICICAFGNKTATAQWKYLINALSERKKHGENMFTQIQVLYGKMQKLSKDIYYYITK